MKKKGVFLLNLYSSNYSICTGNISENKSYTKIE